MNILIGLYQPTSGTIWLKGKKVKIDSPKTAVKLGIGMVHQHFNCWWMSMTGNLKILSLERKRTVPFSLKKKNGKRKSWSFHKNTDWK